MSDLIDRQAAVDALKTDMASLDHIIKGMSGYDVRLDAYVSQRNQVDCDIDTINNLPPVQPELGTNLAEVGTECISRRAVITQLSHNKNKGDEEWELAVENDIQTVWQSPPIQPKIGKCKWCERLKERNLRIEYYWIDQEGCTASFSEPHIVATGIAKFCPNCGAKLTEGDAE